MRRKSAPFCLRHNDTKSFTTTEHDVGILGIAASWVVTRYHGISDRHGNVRATAEMVVREAVCPARQSASLGKCLLVDDSPGIQMPNAANTVELGEALDVGIAELDAGLGVETTPDELMAEISAELGLDEQ